MTPLEIQLITTSITIFGAGVSAYVGVRVALVRIQGEVTRNRDKIDSTDKRVDRIENKVF